MNVGLVLDCIHSMERKLVKPKDKMLPATLFDIQRFHNLKSKTGVEQKNLEMLLMQARMAQENQDYGLSLQFSQQKSYINESGQKFTESSANEQSNQAEINKVESNRDDEE